MKLAEHFNTFLVDVVNLNQQGVSEADLIILAQRYGNTLFIEVSTGSSVSPLI